MQAAMVGRGAEMAALRESLEEARRGRRRLVLVSGEPGIGKSRLLDEFALQASADGADVAWGRCWEAGGAPAYWPWPELLRETLRLRGTASADATSGSRGTLSQLLPEIGAGSDPVPRVEDPDTARFLLFEAVAELFRAAGHDRAVVLLLDDLHAADESSLLLLQFLAADAAPAKLLLVAAYRDVEHRSGGPLTDVAGDLARLPATTRLTLTGLSRDEVAEFTELTASVAPSALLAARLRDQTDGNPLYVAEVVRLLAAEGRLSAESGLERLTMPRDVRETVRRRLERLPDQTKEALRTASVFGRDFRIDALAAVAGGSPLQALANAEGAYLVSAVPERPAHLRFSHAVIAEALYDELPLATRMELHARAGETLERLYVDDVESHLAELARHFCAALPAGDVGKAVDYSLRAADTAVQLLAYEEGVRLYALAVRTMDATGAGAAETRSRALLALGDAQARAGDSTAAKATFIRAAELARRARNGRDLARAALGYGGRFVWFRAGTDPIIVPLLREAIVAVPDDEPALRARLLGRLSGALRDEPSMDERDALSAEAVALARRLDDPAVLAYTLAARYTAIWGPDFVEELESIAAEVERSARDTHDPERLSDAYLFRFESALTAGKVGEMRFYARQSAELADRIRQPSHLWYVGLMRSIMLVLEADLRAAEALIENTRRAGARAQGWDTHADWLLILPTLRWEQGSLPDLEDRLVQARTDYPGYPVFKCLLALVHAESGRHAVAATIANALLPGQPNALPRDNGWLAGMTILAEVASLLGDRGLAAALHEAMYPYAHLVGAVSGEAVTGSLYGPLGQLATVLGRYDEAQRHFEAALDVHRRMEAPALVCHTEYEYARMLQQRGNPTDLATALTLLEDAFERADKVGLALMSARIRTLTSGGGTSPAPAGTTTEHVFRRDGEYWRIGFDGTDFRLRHSKGLEYLAALLARPRMDVAAIDLVSKRGSTPAQRQPGVSGSIEGDLGSVLDDRARAEYRRRLEDLQAELDEAEGWGDSERAARAKAEMDFLASELAAAVGLRGRARQAGSPAERARQSVRKAISSAIERIAAHDAGLARHLNATVSTGYMCRYEPDPRVPMEWHT